ncbi:hypothetical protein CWE12_13140 [Aliidiomarina sedimenti]|uniref:BON domain-containing protein n=1 Tax=Aliidiomarina sedimenti TaxID=1933879 RepID=A0ABY0BUF9_9GAMM|nr:hypothetical protein [Aliidiomarina sedimenti]RUO27876.1 hypothetical protein CWE12_13140 [Aliidiomarina sedimenti]
MSTFKYKPYYKFDGQTHSSPSREELSPEEAEERVRCFFEDIAHYFEDNIAINKEGDLVSISGDIKQSDCDELVKKCLNSLDLFAHKIS